MKIPSAGDLDAASLKAIQAQTRLHIAQLAWCTRRSTASFEALLFEGRTLPIVPFTLLTRAMTFLAYQEPRMQGFKCLALHEKYAVHRWLHEQPGGASVEQIKKALGLDAMSSNFDTDSLLQAMKIDGQVTREKDMWASIGNMESDSMFPKLRGYK